jgi:nucleotidyltransferase/DNA polymerase involved in DNA repair
MFQNMNPLLKSTAVAEILFLMFVSFLLGYFLKHFICEKKHGKESVKEKKVLEEKVDDLKVVEGIGPAIEKLLNAEGIKNYTQLAQAKKEDLQKALSKGGSFFLNHNCDSWGEQAALLRDDKIEEFKKLTEELKGGVRYK